MIPLVPLLLAIASSVAAPTGPELDAPAPPPSATAATVPVPSSVRALPATYVAALREAGVAPRNAAVVIRPLDSGGIAASENAGTAMSPASTMKLVTTWSALNLLGPAYSWRTEVYATAPVVGGALDGTLVFRGGGDPTLVIENLWLLVQRLRDTGLRELRGDVLLDRSAFAAVPHDPEAGPTQGPKGF